MRSWIAITARRLRGTQPGGGPAMPADEADISDASVRTALARVLQNDAFDATPRLRRFLSYIVEEALAGRAERIKAFSIATDVFGRGSDFDAHADPIVRLEAGRLRRSLARYYAGAGADDPILISIPKGAYVPVFEPRAAAAEAAAAAAPPRSRRHVPPGLAAAAALLVVAAVATWTIAAVPWRAAPRNPAFPRLLVQPFEDLTGTAASKALARGLTQEIIGQLARFKDIVIIEGGDGDASRHDARYVLTGGVNLAAGKLRLQARVVNAEDSAVLWAETYESGFEPSRVIAIETEVARQVATTLGQPYGVIFTADVRREVQDPPEDWAAYSCTLAYFSYRANLDAASHPQVRRCLESAVARFPTYATAWALLAQTYIDEIRFRYPVGGGTAPASLDRALAAAKHAVDLEPQNVRAMQAQMLALYFDGQVDASLEIGARALATNPNDTELLGEYGARVSDMGQWDRGCPMIERAVAQNPGPRGYFEALLAICAYVRGESKAAVAWIRKAAVVGNPAYHLLAAAFYAEGGLAAEADAERRWLLEHAPDFVADVRSWAGLRNVRPQDRERFIASLRKAGFVIPPPP